MAVFNNGSTGIYDYGPGDSPRRPHYNRYIKITNSTGYNMFLPDNSAGEKQSVFNNILSVPGVSGRGPGNHYYSGSYVYQNPSVIGNGPCWCPNAGGSYNNPAGCPSGFTQEIAAVDATGNPNSQSGVANINHPTAITDGYGNVSGYNNGLWVAFQALNYGCPSGCVGRFRTRICRF